jgi:uncharacterized protein (TIRG00374 family)
LLVVVALAGLAVVAIRVVYGSGPQLVEAADVLGRVNAGWLIVALVLEAGSYISFAQGQRVLLRSAGRPLGLPSLTAMATAGQALANCIPAGVAASSVYIVRQQLRIGVDGLLSGEVQVIQNILYMAALAVLAFAGAQIAGDTSSTETVPGLRYVAIGLLAAMAVIIAITAVLRRRGLDVKVYRWVVRRMASDRETADRLASHTGTLSPGRRDWVFASLATGATWLLDCGCLAACFTAIGASVPWRGLLLTYCAGQLATALPISPGGLGVVEGSLTVALTQFGGSATSTLAAVLLYRMYSYWAILPAGLGCHLALRRGVRRPSEVPT